MRSPNKRRCSPWGQFNSLLNWPQGWLAEPGAFLRPPGKLCIMLQQDHLHLIIFTLIIFGLASQINPRPLFFPSTHTRTHRHFNLGSSADRGPGWTGALGSSSLRLLVLLTIPVPLARFLFYLISCPVLLFFLPSFHFHSAAVFDLEQQHNSLNSKNEAFCLPKNVKKIKTERVKSWWKTQRLFYYCCICSELDCVQVVAVCLFVGLREFPLLSFFDMKQISCDTFRLFCHKYVKQI